MKLKTVVQKNGVETVNTVGKRNLKMRSREINEKRLEQIIESTARTRSISSSPASAAAAHDMVASYIVSSWSS